MSPTLFNMFILSVQPKGAERVMALLGEVKHRPFGPDQAFSERAETRSQRVADSGSGNGQARTLTEVREAQPGGEVHVGMFWVVGVFGMFGRWNRGHRCVCAKVKVGGSWCSAAAGRST